VTEPFDTALRDQMRGFIETRVMAISTDGPAFELREVPNGTGGTKLNFEGYASVVERGYDVWAPSVGDFTEVIDQRAFAKTLSENPDVSLKINHEGLPLARSTAGDLRLSADSTGLLAGADLNPERSDVKLLRQAVEAGHLGAMSFAFRVTRQDWSDDGATRRISEVNLNRGDVSIVEHPANGATTGMMSLRNAVERTMVTTDTPAMVSEIRAKLADADEAVLKHILSLVSAADTAVDEAQPLLADLLGVPNPDIAQDAAMDRSSGDEGIEVRQPSRLAIAQLRAVASHRR